MTALFDDIKKNRDIIVQEKKERIKDSMQIKEAIKSVQNAYQEKNESESVKAIKEQASKAQLEVEKVNKSLEKVEREKSSTAEQLQMALKANSETQTKIEESKAETNELKKLFDKQQETIKD